MKVRKKKQMLWRLFLMLLCCGAVLMGTTYAWRSVSQRTVNEFVEEPDTVPVELWKCLKLADGTLTDTPLPGVAFYLYRQDGIRVGGIYTTDEMGKISTWLPKGDYYFEEIAPGDGYDYDVDEEGMVVKRYPFTVTGEEEELVEVLAYNVSRTGSLVIRKWVRNADDTELTQGQLAQEFAFLVTFSDGGTYSYRIDGGVLESLKSGEILYLKHGQEAVFEGLPEGVTCTVTEQELALEQGQYLTRADGHFGTITKEGSISAFINVYLEEELTPRPVKLRVTKQVIGPVPETDADRAFDMTIEINGVKQEFALKDGESKEFDVVVGDCYEVTEKEYFEDGYAQEITAGAGAGAEDTEVVVKNRYMKQIYADILVEKEWHLEAALEVTLPEYIKVQLKQGELVVDEKVVRADEQDNWETLFHVPQYDAEGKKILYTVEELPVEGFWTTYDESRANEGIFTIINTPQSPLSVMLPELEKQVSGEDAPVRSFEFWLKGETGAPMPADATGQTKIVTIEGMGSTVLGELTFTKAGEYRYTLTEVQEDAEGWNYDGSVYTLLVKVYEEENGNLAALQVLLKDGQQANVIRFENQYQEEKPDDEVQLPNDSDTPEEPPVEEPDTTDTGEGADTAKPTIYGTVRTGDTAGYARYLWLLGGSMLVLLLVIYWRRHKKSSC